MNPLVFRCSKRTIQSHIINSQPFLSSFGIFHAFTDFLSKKTHKFISSTNEIWKGWKLAWYHHFTHIACPKSWEGCGKNWMHFVYKSDNLFRSIRFLTKTQLLQKGFHFSTYLNSRLFVCSKCTIQGHIINLQHFLSSFGIFHALTDFFRLNGP